MNQQILSLVVPMARGHTIVRTTRSLISIPPPKFLNTAKSGAFDIEFYRHQAEYILWNESQSNRTFKWEHPFRIKEDKYGVIWYYNKQRNLYWRPTSFKLTDSVSWIYRESSINHPQVHLILGTQPYPTLTFTDSECRQ